MGLRPSYVNAAQKLGRTLARRGLSVVYGGAHVGLMGALADGALEAGGEVIGIIPESMMAREIGHARISDLRVVRSMHERKAAMESLADAFIALPGGMGTLEEFCEILTWGQLGLHRKPCGLLNIDGYYTRLLGFLDHMVEERFLKHVHREWIVVEDEPERLLDRLQTTHPPLIEKWIRASET
jgi:uncharacterized protein (TIGR00730 family)